MPALVMGRCQIRYDETIEIAFEPGIDPPMPISGSAALSHPPGGTGKTVRVVVFARGDKKPMRQRRPVPTGCRDLANKIQTVYRILIVVLRLPT